MSYFPPTRRPRVINLDTPLATPLQAVPGTPAPSYHTISPGPRSPPPGTRAPLFSRPFQSVPSALTRSQHPPAAAAPRQTNQDQPQTSTQPVGIDAPGYTATGTATELDTFLRHVDRGRYPLMPNVNSQPAPALGAQRPQQPVTRSGDVVPINDGSTVVERRRGLRMHLNLLGLNRLPTVSSHVSQEGTQRVESTRVPSTRSRRSTKVQTNVKEGDENMESSGVSHRGQAETDSGADAPHLPTESLGAEIARFHTRSSRAAMQEVDANVQSIQGSDSYQATGRLHRSRSSRRSREVPPRPPTPPPKDEPQAAVPKDEPRATRANTRALLKVEKSRERKAKVEENDNAARWVLYDEQGDVKRIWKLEYSSDKIKPNEKPKRPSKRERRVEREQGEIPRARAADMTVETWATRVEEARAVISEGAEVRAREARTVISEVTQAVSQITTSDDVAYCHGIFEAQEHIAALEAEQDSIREALRKQAQRMYLLPDDQIQVALKERVEMKEILTLLQKDIDGWKEVIGVLQRNLRNE